MLTPRFDTYESPCIRGAFTYRPVALGGCTSAGRHRPLVIFSPAADSQVSSNQLSDVATLRLAFTRNGQPLARSQLGPGPASGSPSAPTGAAIVNRCRWWCESDWPGLPTGAMTLIAFCCRPKPLRPAAKSARPTANCANLHSTVFPKTFHISLGVYWQHFPALKTLAPPGTAQIPKIVGFRTSGFREPVRAPPAAISRPRAANL